MDDVVIYPSRTKLLLLALGSLVFVLVGVFIAQQEQVLIGPLEVIVGSYIGVPFFGLCFVYAVYRLLDPKPAVIISMEGLFDNASAIGVGMLPWEEITDVYLYEFMGQRMLGIVIQDGDALIERQPHIRRVIAKINRSLVGSPINISQVSLPISIEELLERIEEHRSLSRQRAEQALEADSS